MKLGLTHCLAHSAIHTNILLLEQFREDDDFETYGFEPLTVNGEVVNTTDLIRRRWLDNDFYGTVFSANYVKNELR